MAAEAEVRTLDVTAFFENMGFTRFHLWVLIVSSFVTFFDGLDFSLISVVLPYLRDEMGKLPHVYFGWSEGNPISYLLKYIAFGEGDTAPVTHEVLRQAEKDSNRRPIVHVGG